ncbi:MAG: helical backbone metal receptor [Arcobacteraceae bacterium]
MKLLLILLFSITLYASPRVIALSPSINEIIFALGKGDTLVANTEFSNYPEEAKLLPKVGGYFSVDLERVVALKPDMVMLQAYDMSVVNSLEKLKINYMLLKTNSMNDIVQTIEKIADFYEEKEKSQEILTVIHSSLKSIENIISNKKILMVISATTNFSKPIYVVGHDVYLEDVILRSNNQNAYNVAYLAQPTINLETIIKLNPDIIVLLAPYLSESKITKETLLNKWKTIPINASKKNNIYVIDKEYAGIPSQRVRYFIDDFKKVLDDARNK